MPFWLVRLTLWLVRSSRPFITFFGTILCTATLALCSMVQVVVVNSTAFSHLHGLLVLSCQLLRWYAPIHVPGPDLDPCNLGIQRHRVEVATDLIHSTHHSEFDYDDRVAILAARRGTFVHSSTTLSVLSAPL